MKKQLLLASMLALAPLPVLASAFYVSVDAGQAGFDGDGLSESDGAYGLGIGFRFNRVLSLEIAARDLGGYSESFRGEDEGGEWYEKYESSYLSLQHSLLINIPIGNAGIYGRLGMAHLFADDEYSYEETWFDEVDSYSESESDNKTVALGGIGFKYDITSSFTVRTEYNIYSKWEELKTSFASVGMTYRF